MRNNVFFTFDKQSVRVDRCRMIKALRKQWFKRSLGTVALAAALPFAVSGQAASEGQGANAQENVAQEVEELKNEFISIKTQLEQAQAKALEQEKVQKAIASVDEALESAMLDEAPEKKETIEDYFELRSEFAEMEAKGEQPTSQQKIEEFQQMHQELEPIMKEVSDSEEVAQARNESRETVIAAMTDINPNTLQLLERQQQLMQRFQSLRQQR